MSSDANRSGRAVEDAFAAVLLSRGIEFSRQVVVGISIYGTPLRVDFVLHNVAAFPLGLIIESKWQDVGGSVDEKFPFLVANIRAECYGRPVIVVVSGGGCRPGAFDWLRCHVDGEWLYAVFGMEEFFSWVQRGAIPISTSPSSMLPFASNREND